MRGAVFVLLLASLVFTRPAPTHAGEAIKIGLDIPLTGSAAAIGQYLLWGARIAVDEANARGGAQGKPFELLPLDDETDSNKALENVRDLVDNHHVALVLGPANSGAALAFIPFLQERRVPNMLLTASATTLTRLYEHEPKNYIFRATLPDAEQIHVLIHWAAKRFSRIAIASDSTPYGRLGRADMIKALAEHGVTPKAMVEFDLGDQDMAPQVKRLQEEGVDGLAVLSMAPEIANLVRSADANGFKPVFFGLYPFFLPSIANLPTRLSDGLSAICGATPQDSPKAAEIDRIVRRDSLKEGYYPFKFVVAGYEGTALALQAVAAAGSVEGEKVRDALEAVTRFEGVNKTFLRPFSKTNHELYVAEDIYLATWKNGKIVRLDKE